MYLKLVNSNVDWASLNVNEHWNALEDIIISCVDNCAPLKTFVINESNFETIPGTIKNKINKRNRLLRSRNIPINAPLIRSLNNKNLS